MKELDPQIHNTDTALELVVRSPDPAGVSARHQRCFYQPIGPCRNPEAVSSVAHGTMVWAGVKPLGPNIQNEPPLEEMPGIVKRPHRPQTGSKRPWAF